MSGSTAASKIVPFESLDPTIQTLLKEAVKAREFAYHRYSNFKVGACLICKDGRRYTGCNVENSSFNAICAERTAYVKAISEGNRSFQAVAVIAYQEDTIVTPCGVCRQFMSEFGNVDLYLARPDLKEVFVSDLNEMLPYQFKLHR